MYFYHLKQSLIGKRSLVNICEWMLNELSYQKYHEKNMTLQTSKWANKTMYYNFTYFFLNLFQIQYVRSVPLFTKKKKKTSKRNSTDIKIALLKINNNKLFVLTKIPVSKAILFSFNSGKINPSSKYLETYGTLLSTCQRWEWDTEMEVFFKSHNEVNNQIQLTFRVRVNLLQSYILLLSNIFLRILCIDTILKWLLCIST